jgi:predicted phosphodiesterase
VRGNTDRYVLTGEIDGMIPTVHDPELLTEIHASLAWTRAAISDAGHAEWLRDRPIEDRACMRGGSRVLLVHASPGRDDGPGAQPDATDEELASLGFTGEVADLVLVGHTHLALDRHVHHTRVVNPGPVSLPRERDGLARWAVLTAREGGYDVDLRRTAYDLGGVLADLHRVGHPAAGWIAGKLGEERASH